MLISESEFRDGLNNASLRKQNIIILGMSGSGKTYWSKKLSERFGFNHVEVDDLIATSNEFFDLIKDFPGRDDTEKCGNYFGKPWDKGFQSKEDSYLAIEKKIMSREFLPGIVLDLTGSAIYHPEQMLRLSKKGMVICLETTEQVQEEMLQLYINDPKPVCWSGMFNKKEGETNEQALARCYPILLTTRAKLYDKYTDVKLPFEVHKNLHDPEDFVEEVCRQLRNQKN